MSKRLLLAFCIFPLSAHAELVRLQPEVDGKIVHTGCSVSLVRPSSSANRADIQAGDVILEAGGAPVGSIEDLHHAVTLAGADLSLKIKHAEKESVLTVPLDAEKGGPRLGVECQPMPSAPFVFQAGTFTVTAQASMVQDLTLVRVRITNNSQRIIQISPHLFSAADGNRLMLKLLEPRDVATILQADLRNAAPSQTPIETGYQNSMTPMVHTLGSYIFGTMGLKGNANALATAVADGLSEAAAVENVPLDSAATPPTITPALVAREALDSSDLEPGYSVEGIVFFNAVKSLPLILMMRIDQDKTSVVFNAASALPVEALDNASSSDEKSGDHALSGNLCSGPRQLHAGDDIESILDGLHTGDRLTITCTDGSTVNAVFASADVSGHVWVITRNPLQRHILAIQKIAAIKRG